MDPKPIIIINCRSLKSLRSDLIASLHSQSTDFDLKILESSTCPSRLNQIKDENSLYFFLDEDVVIPGIEYVRNIWDIFNQNKDLLLLGGKYLISGDQSYLAQSYNSQIEFWLSKSAPNSSLAACQNLPGGVWIFSGKIKKYLEDWKEPKKWAGEDTFSIRWLQKKGLKTFHHSSADVFHYPQSHFLYFCRRAFLQGESRYKFQLFSDYSQFNWNLIWKYRKHLPGWILHQIFVELGSLASKIKSLIPQNNPINSPVPYKR